MRKSILSLGLVGGLALTTVSLVPASAAPPWFGPAQSSAINNGVGPGPAPRGTATADFDSDGRPDLVTVGNFTFGDVVVALGTGGGAFGSGTSVAGTSGTQGLDAGDVTGDGDADIVVMSTTAARVYVGDGAGHFTAGGSYPLTLGGQVQPLIVDVDADGDNDIVAPTFTAIQTLLNSGTGTFTTGPRTTVAGASVLSAIAVAKLDPGTRPDLFAVDGFSGTTFALVGTGGGAFSVRGNLYGTAFVPEDVAAIDLDGDGFDDAATVGSFSFSLATGLTDGTGKFRSSVPQYFQYGGPGPTSAAVADFDEDGRDDLVVSSLANPASGTLTVLAGNGTPGMRKVGTFATPAFPQNPVPADYDGDGDVDLAVVSPGSAAYLPNTTP